MARGGLSRPAGDRLPGRVADSPGEGCADGEVRNPRAADYQPVAPRDDHRRGSKFGGSARRVGFDHKRFHRSLLPKFPPDDSPVVSIPPAPTRDFLVKYR